MSLLTEFQEVQNKINTATLATKLILNATTVPIQTNLVYSNNTYQVFSNKYIDTGVAQSSLSSGYTIFVTIHPYSWSNYKGVFGDHRYGGIIGLQYENGGIYMGHFQPSASVDLSGYITTNQTYNIAVRVSDSSTKLNVWINGEKVVKDYALGGFTAYGNLLFGRAYPSTERYFDGKLGYIYVYNTALSDVDITYMNAVIEKIQVI